MKKVIVLIICFFAWIDLIGQEKFSNQSTIYNKGVKHLVYETPDYMVAITAERVRKSYSAVGGKNLRVIFIIINKSDRIIDYVPKFTAYTVAKGKKKDLNVLSYAQFCEKQDMHDLLWGGTSSTIASSQTVTDVKDSYGNSIGQIETKTKISDSGEKYMEMKTSRENAYLKRDSIFPDKENAGFIIIENFKTDEFILSAFVENKEFVFHYVFD